jgi:hypothetical protein
VIALIADQRDARWRGGASGAGCVETEGGIAMGALWTVVTLGFTFGVFALIGFALWHVFVAARDNSPRLRH